jgi:hypothetical protein
MIDTKELRRLAQAATPGPDGVSLSWIRLLRDFQQGASPAAISELLDRLEAAEKERDFAKTEIARLHDDIRELTDERVLDEEDRDRIVAWRQGTSTKPAPSVPDGWKEAAIAWEVCASIHREYGKGKDPFFNTRQGDFVKHANDARAMLAVAPEAKP